MKVYMLTSYGHSIARGTRNPNTGTYRTISFIDRVGGRATSDQLADNGATAADIVKLKRAGAIREMGGEDPI